MVKLQTNAESAANDAKTARLKALRLEKERQEAIEAAANPPTPVRRKKVRPAPKRIIGSLRPDSTAPVNANVLLWEALIARVQMPASALLD